MFKRTLLFTLLVVLFFPCNLVIGQPLPLTPAGQVTVGGRPESVIGDQNFLYASNLGTGSTFARDGNGYISKLSYEGNLITQTFLSIPGVLDGPTGMAFLGDQLFVADLDEIIGFDLTGQANPRRINLQSFGPSFLNDLVAVSDQHLVVSATNLKRLYLVDTIAGSAEQLQLDFTLNHPNGLAYDSSTGHLYVAANRQHSIGSNASNGEVLKLDLDIVDKSADFVSRASNAGRFLDGISLFDDDQLIYSDWVSSTRASGILGRLNLDDLSPATPNNLNLRGFADFHWQASRGILAAPNLLGGEVQLFQHPIPEPSTLCLALLSLPLLLRHRNLH